MTDPSDRMQEFEAELARLRLRPSAPSNEQRLLLAGIVLMPLGLLLVLAGWFGASGTTDFSSQVPYVLSGGILGIGCTIVGAVLFLRYSLARYFRFWLLRLIYEERATADRLGEILAQHREETQV